MDSAKQEYIKAGKGVHGKKDNESLRDQFRAVAIKEHRHDRDGCEQWRLAADAIINWQPNILRDRYWGIIMAETSDSCKPKTVDHQPHHRLQGNSVSSMRTLKCLS